MLKIAVYLNVFILFCVSVIYLCKAFDNKLDLKKLRHLMVIYALYAPAEIYLCSSDILDIGWDFIFLNPLSVTALIIYITGIVFTSIKIKKADNLKDRHFNPIIYTSAIILPLLIFAIPYKYELDILNNCDYLLKYNYQNGIIQSDDTYIAIVNDKPKTVTLQKNLYEREGISVNWQKYRVIFNDDIEISTRDSHYNKVITENEEIKKIALNAAEKHPEAKSAHLEYFTEKGCAVITLLDGENSGAVLGEYFYCNDRLTAINTQGSLKEAVYYK